MTRWDNPIVFECSSCRADFRYDESPSTDLCADCEAWHSWWAGARETELHE